MKFNPKKPGAPDMTETQQYRKKPVVIDAWLAEEDATFPEGAQIRRLLSPTGSARPQWQVFDALHETWVNFELGDWIIKGVRGEFYPCKPDVFAETYEPVAALLASPQPTTENWENDPYLHELAANHANGKGGWELILKFFRRLLASPPHDDDGKVDVWHGACWTPHNRTCDIHKFKECNCGIRSKT